MTCVYYRKKAARLILYTDCSERSAHLFRKLGWMSLADRLKYQRAVQMYKCSNKECPSSLQGIFMLKAKVHNLQNQLGLQTIENLHLPKCHQKSIRYTGRKTWNKVRPACGQKGQQCIFIQETVQQPLPQHTNFRLVTVQVSSIHDTVLVAVVLEMLVLRAALKISDSSADCTTLLK